MISLPWRSIASHTARFSSSLSVIATPFQPRSAVARHSAPPNANDTGTDRLSATAAVPGFGDLNVDADRRPQFHRKSGRAVDRRLQPNDMRRLRESDFGGRLIAGLRVDAQIRAVLFLNERGSGR
jgi:hypothetical protein